MIPQYSTVPPKSYRQNSHFVYHVRQMNRGQIAETIKSHFLNEKKDSMKTNFIMQCLFLNIITNKPEMLIIFTNCKLTVDFIWVELENEFACYKLL